MEDRNDEEIYKFKVIVVGDKGTGKSCLIMRFVKNAFTSNYKTTVGVDFALKDIEIDKNKTVSLQIWDIAGQERFGVMTRNFYKSAMGAILVFDITNRKTFEHIKTWKKDIEDKLDSEEEIPFILVCNKSDLIDELPQCVEDSEIEELVESCGFYKWYKTSAKDGTNVSEAMHTMVHKILETAKPEKPNQNKGVQLKIEEQKREQPEKSSNCCSRSL